MQTGGQLLPTHACKTSDGTNKLGICEVDSFAQYSMMNDDDKCDGVRCNVVLNKI